MKRISVCLATVALLGAACATSSSAPEPSPSARIEPNRSTLVSCIQQPRPVMSNIFVGGVEDASPGTLATAIGGRVTTASSRAELARRASERSAWQEQLLADAASGEMIVVLQRSDFHRETATLLAGSGARIIVALPRHVDPAEIAAGYPPTTAFIVTAERSEGTAAITAAESGELADVLKGAALCAPITVVGPSPTPTDSPTSKPSPNGSPTASRSASPEPSPSFIQRSEMGSPTP